MLHASAIAVEGSAAEAGLPQVIEPSWHTIAAHVALTSKQPVGSKVVVVIAVGLLVALQQIERKS